MSQYEALANHLSRRSGTSWKATFAEIETIIGKKLPQSAYRYPAWWANQSGKGHSQVRGWRSVGWRTSALNLADRSVRFERDGSGESDPGHDDEQERLLLRARQLTGNDDRTELIVAGLKALIAREAGERLIAMGGMIPDFDVAPRERPFE